MKSIFSLFLLFAGLLFLFSCKKELSWENYERNQPPTANAGPDKVITLPTDSVLLNGSGSSDPDGNISSYIWTKIAGPAPCNIVNATAVQTQVGNLVSGIYQFELKVTDSGGLFSKDTVSVSLDVIKVNGCNAIADIRNALRGTLSYCGKHSQKNYHS